MLTLAASGSLFVLFGLAAGAVVAAMAFFYGWQSLQQARVLRRPTPIADLESCVGRMAAVCGIAEPLDPAALASGIWVWVETETRTPRRTGSGRRSTRVQRERRGFDFVLRDGDAEVVVRAQQATEAHGTDCVMGAGTGAGHGAKQNLYVLRAGDRLLACGLVAEHEGRLELRAGEETGLLLSSLTPESQAAIEALKGWLCVVGPPLLWLVALAWYMVETS